jgi:hypothetical protein
MGATLLGNLSGGSQAMQATQGPNQGPHGREPRCSAQSLLGLADQLTGKVVVLAMVVQSTLGTGFGSARAIVASGVPR